MKYSAPDRPRHDDLGEPWQEPNEPYGPDVLMIGVARKAKLAPEAIMAHDKGAYVSKARRLFVLEMHRQGHSIRQTARYLKRDVSTIHTQLRKAKQERTKLP